MVTMTTSALLLAVTALIVGKNGLIESFRGRRVERSSFLRRSKHPGRKGMGWFKPSLLCSQMRQQDEEQHQHQQQQQQQHHHKQFPIPAMPSDNFRKMAQSQLELLANSLTQSDNPSVGKVQSMILYLPQENSYSGQLEFTPAVLYPDPSTERVFIASDAASGQAPTLPKSLSKLPGFSSAPELLPGYPMLTSVADHPGVGVVEEVLCDIRFRTAALSVPLLSGSQTVGVLLVSSTGPQKSEKDDNGSSGNDNDNDPSGGDSDWTKRDKRQVSLAAQSLSMALTMENERTVLSQQNDVFRESLSDSLHQMKNPIQALRTYGKILQRQILETCKHSNGISSGSGSGTAYNNDVGGTARLLELAERLMVQSDRVVDMLGPMDSLVETLDHQQQQQQQQQHLGPSGNSPVMLPPAMGNNTVGQTGKQSMVLYSDRSRSSNRSSNATTNRQTETIDRSSPRERLLVPEAFSDPVPATRYFNTTFDGKDVEFPVPTETDDADSGGSNRKTRASEGGGGFPASVIGDFETEMVFITDVLEPIFDTFRAIASERGISFEVLIDDVDDLPGVFVAPKSLQEAVSNVLDNALKYVVLPKAGSPFSSNPSPRVRVWIFPNDRCCQRENAEEARATASSSSSSTVTATATIARVPGVTVLVEDNGPGVASDDRQLIFQRGFRSDRTASEVDGRGIGLDISRTLMARMGGCLDVADSEDYESCAEWIPDRDDDDEEECFLDGAAIKLEVSRKPHASSVGGGG